MRSKSIAADGRWSRKQAISLAGNRQMVGQNLGILTEGAGGGISMGHSYRDASEVDGLVFIEGELPSDQMVSVRIIGALEYDLVGEIEQVQDLAPTCRKDGEADA